ncbi:MAG TPA: carbohydrate ABC transporter permease [Clostridiaceae bacterium]|nr:carbohydrate ABC transporter permease [Clostridiaceae bacterium]
MSRFSQKTGGFIGVMDLKRLRVRVLYWCMFSFLFLVSLVLLVPPLWIILSSLKDVREFYATPPSLLPKTLQLWKVVEVWNKLEFLRYYGNSFIVVAGCVASTIIFNGLLAYGISRLKPRGSKFIFGLILASIMLPSTVGMVPLFKDITNLKLMNSFVPLWLMSGATAFVVMVYKNFYDNIPSSLFDAAEIDGCSTFGVFWNIVVPLSKAINMVIIIITVNSSWSEFFWSFMILREKTLQTVMVRIYVMSTSFSSVGYGIDYQLVALTFAILPPVIMFIFFQKYIIQGIALTGIKG